MRSLSRYTSNDASRRGFTLVEILIVVSLVVLLGALGLWAGMDVYRGYSFRSEQSIFIGALEKARLASMLNVNETPHGVHVESGKYVVFQGSAYGVDPALNEVITPSYSVTLGGSPTLPRDVVFRQLDGAVATPGTFTIASGARSVTITINYEGQINW